MSTSLTFSETMAFTLTHARHMGAKVATDLKRMQRFYGKPSDALISLYEKEIIALLKSGYLGTVTYGFQKDGAWIEPSLVYTARDLANSAADDDDPGRVRPGADTTGAVFTSFLSRNSTWVFASSADRAAFEASLPFQRGAGTEPPVNGCLRSDRTYSSGGRALDRQSVQAW